MPQTDTSRPPRLHTLTSNPTLIELSKERERGRQQKSREPAGRKPKRSNGATTRPAPARRTEAEPHGAPGNTIAGTPLEAADGLAVARQRRRRDETRAPYGWRRD